MPIALNRNIATKVIVSPLSLKKFLTVSLDHSCSMHSLYIGVSMTPEISPQPRISRNSPPTAAGSLSCQAGRLRLLHVNGVEHFAALVSHAHQPT